MTGVFETMGAFAPGLLWLWYTHRKDQREPEPQWLVPAVFALGGCATMAMLSLRPLLDPVIPAEPKWAHGVVDAFVVTALTEELLKVAAFCLGILWTRYLSEPMDGIIYGAAVGLGFASVENALYLAGSGDLSVLLMRAFTATILHACIGAGLGFCLAMARLGIRHPVLLISGGLLVAVILHGLYDIFLFIWPELKMISLLFVLPALIAIMGLITHWCQKVSPRYHP
jgi:RsiW-degrading membrane proteinase PrsW (M82 family)